jgi:hypothetical protein
MCHLAICHDHDREMWLATTVQAWTRLSARRSVLHAAQKSNFLSISLQFPTAPIHESPFRDGFWVEMNLRARLRLSLAKRAWKSVVVT